MRQRRKGLEERCTDDRDVNQYAAQELAERFKMPRVCHDLTDSWKTWSWTSSMSWGRRTATRIRRHGCRGKAATALWRTRIPGQLLLEEGHATQ